jgi:LysR family hydrogen peroxide-inducible transcriptional activator
MQIHKLEEELGVQLFNRRKHPVEVTELGRKIIDQARVVYREAEKIEQLINLHKGKASGPFHLGIIPTVAPSLIPLFVRQFSEAYPEVQLVVEEMQTQDIVDRLNTDLLDAGIVATPLHEKDILESPLYYEPFHAYFPTNHPNAQRENVSAGDLKADEILLLHEGHCFRNHVVSFCRAQFDNDRTHNRPLRFESGNFDTLRKLVQQGFGMTLLPDLYVQELAEANGFESRARIVPFAAPMPGREISLIYRKEQLKKQIIDLLRDNILYNIPERLKSRNNLFLVDPK